MQSIQKYDISDVYEHAYRCGQRPTNDIRQLRDMDKDVSGLYTKPRLTVNGTRAIISNHVLLLISKRANRATRPKEQMPFCANRADPRTRSFQFEGGGSQLVECLTVLRLSCYEGVRSIRRQQSYRLPNIDG